LVLAAVGLAACSSVKSTSSAPPPVSLSGRVNNHGTKDASTVKSLEIEQDNFYFDPTFVKAAPGTSMTVTLSNEGKVQHTFTIDALHVDQVVDPGRKKTVTVTLPSSETVNFYCRFHRSIGMQGAFYFGAGGATGGSTPSGGSTPPGGSTPAPTSSGSGY
jgi:plastocyanin